MPSPLCRSLACLKTWPFGCRKSRGKRECLLHADSSLRNRHPYGILMMDRLQRETDEEKKIAVVLDNARFHHARALTDLYAPGQALERITPIYLPPYAPDHNPTEHVWNAAKAHISNIQQNTPIEDRKSVV